MEGSEFNPLLGRMNDEDCFGFHSEYYVDPEWRKAGKDIGPHYNWRYLGKGYTKYSAYQGDVYFIHRTFDIPQKFASYIIKSNVAKKTSCAIRLATKEAYDYIAVNRRGYFLYTTQKITLFDFDGREIYTHKFGQKKFVECIYIYDNMVIYSETKQTAISTQIYCVNMLTKEKALVWGTQKGDSPFDDYLRDSYLQEWGMELPFSQAPSNIGNISCQFLYANKHRVIAGYTRSYGNEVSYVIHVDLARNQWSILDCFSTPGWRADESKYPQWNDRHIFSFNMLEDTMWVKTSDQDIRLIHTDIQGVAQLKGRYSVGWKLCALVFNDSKYYYFDGKFACVPAPFGVHRLKQNGESEEINEQRYHSIGLLFWCCDDVYLIPNEYSSNRFCNITQKYEFGSCEYELNERAVMTLIENAKQPQARATEVKKKVVQAVPHKEDVKYGLSTVKSSQLPLAALRVNAPYMTDFREELLSYRKSLANSWDYNAFVGILLGVRGPKHGDAACMNFAIGQGDNGNNTKKTLEAKGLMPVFEKYKGKNLDASILLSDVEEEILEIAPEYAPIRQKLHEIMEG